MSQYYSISDLCLFTGLTDRTLRNYLSNGILQGEMIDRAWAFTEEQVQTFLQHPSVQPSIQARKNALITDFLLDNFKKSAQMCVVWDLPDREGQSISDFFCRQINADSSLRNFHFSFQNIDGTTRLILKGEQEDIIRLINRFHEHDNR